MSMLTALAAGAGPQPTRLDPASPTQSTAMATARAEAKTTTMPPVKRSDAAAKSDMTTDGDRDLSVTSPETAVLARTDDTSKGSEVGEDPALAERGAAELVALRDVRARESLKDSLQEVDPKGKESPSMDLRIPVPDNLPDKIPVNF